MTHLKTLKIHNYSWRFSKRESNRFCCWTKHTCHQSPLYRKFPWQKCTWASTEAWYFSHQINWLQSVNEMPEKTCWLQTVARVELITGNKQTFGVKWETSYSPLAGRLVVQVHRAAGWDLQVVPEGPAAQTKDPQSTWQNAVSTPVPATHASDSADTHQNSLGYLLQDLEPSPLYGFMDVSPLCQFAPLDDSPPKRFAPCYVSK